MSERDKMSEKALHMALRAERSEKNIERYLVKLAHQHGLAILKMDGRLQTGYPDRLVVLPGGRVKWVELKSKGRRPSKLQNYIHISLREMGHSVSVIDSKEGVDAFFFDLWK